MKLCAERGVNETAQTEWDPSRPPSEPMLYTPAVINLDHNATAPLDPRVRAAMVWVLEQSETLGNPSSVHGLGRAARSIVESARRRVAAAVGADPLGVTFTSGGTEADNLAVLGGARALKRAGHPHGVLTSRLEHPAVTRAALWLQGEGHRIVWVEVDEEGRIEPARVAAAVAEHPDVGLVSLAAANHELGNRYDLPVIVEAVRSVRPEVLVHCDAVQALGKVPIDHRGWGVDLLSISAHKIHGPAGVGALVHGKGTKLDPLFFGGAQERGRRVGTEALVALHGFGVAAELASSEQEQRAVTFAELGRRLWDGLRAMGARRHGDPEASVENTLNVAFDGCEGDLVCMGLDLEGFAVSTGAACSAGSTDPSPVLLALGLSEAQAREGVRLSIGKDTTAEQIDRLLEVLPTVVERIRAAGPRRAAS